MKKIGLLGGTFDPPHIGHLLIAEEVKEALHLDEVWFIPSNEPPHKEKATTGAHHRLKMLQLALRNEPSFKINDIELKREGKSYTIDTVKQLKNQYSAYKFYFIIGADMVEYLPHWYKIDQLIEVVDFVGVGRPGYALKTSYPVLSVNIPLIDISSTQLRKRLREKRTVKYLLPQEVSCYIKEQRLYE